MVEVFPPPSETGPGACIHQFCISSLLKLSSEVTIRRSLHTINGQSTQQLEASITFKIKRINVQDVIKGASVATNRIYASCTGRLCAFVSRMQRGVDTATTVAAYDPWNSLITSMNIFVGLVDKFAEVCHPVR